MKTKLKIDDLARELNLNILYRGDVDEIYVDTSDLNRPGLQMAGFLNTLRSTAYSSSVWWR